jgi:tRNA dimethylallyltransferase
LDLHWPNQACTAGDYARHARAAIENIRSRERIPIIAGGTGLYLRALLEGLAPAPARDEGLRERLRGRAELHGSRWLHRALARMDPEASKQIHPNDTPKLIRSLEVAVLGARPQSEQWRAGRDPLRGFRVLKFGLAPDRKLLHERINARAAAMFARGLVAETQTLRQSFGDSCRALGALGYAQAIALLQGELTEPEAIAAAQAGHRQYAKRQMTWFRRERSVVWLGGFGDDPVVQNETLRLAREHLGQYQNEPS